MRLLATPATFVRDWSIGLSADGKAAEGWARVDGPDAAGAAVVVRLGDREARATADGDGLARFSIDAAGLARW